MFLKRDLGSPLTCQALDEVLERHWVLPLNSPPGYPLCRSGAVEEPPVKIDLACAKP